MKTSPKIDSYRFGQIVIDGKAYPKDVIITPQGVLPNWWRAQGHSLSMADLAEVMKHPPEILVIGQGSFGRMDVPADTRQQLEAAGVQVFTQNTKAACQTYNQLRETKHIVAAS